MVPDWKERLKEIGKELFQEEGKKKAPQAPSPHKASPRSEKTATEIIKNIFGKHTGKDSPSALTVESKPTSPVSTAPKKSGSGRLPEAPREAGDRMTVGLDFGTSFTKVCLRRELGGDDVPIYPQLLPNAAGGIGPSPLWPSLVSVNDGKIYFAQSPPSGGSSGTRYPHLKVCLACTVEGTSHDCVSSELCPFAKDPTLASDLVTLYLGWVMREARQRVQPPVVKHPLSNVYNVGVPIKHLDWGANDRLYKKYRKIAYDAWRLSEGLVQGMELKQAQVWIEKLREKSVPPPEKSRVQLAPESSAAIVSYVNSVKALQGLYSIVDIGAWTTDISFFRLTDISTSKTGVSRLAFYAAEVWRRAANAIDEKLVRCLLEFMGGGSIKDFMQSDIVDFLRTQRETGRLGKTEVSFRTESDKEDKLKIFGYILDYSRGVVCQDVRRAFTRTFRVARKKEPTKWEGFTLFLTGGGSQEPGFRDAIYERYEHLRPNLREDMLSFPTLQPHGNVLVSKRLAVAAGLSYPLGMWPEEMRPSEVPDWPGPRLAKTPELIFEPG